MPTIKRFLVCPSDNPEYSSVAPVWEEWKSQSDTLTIEQGDMDGLRYTYFLDKIDPTSGQPEVSDTLTIGGQRTNLAVHVFLDALAHHPRIQNKDVSLQIDSQAVFPPDPENIQAVIDDIFRLYAVTINVI